MSADPEATMDLPVIESLEPLPPFRADDVTEERPFPLFPIGDALIAAMPGFDILPCGRCGTRFGDAPPAALRRARILSWLVVLAGEAGWAADPDYGWCCPACLAALVHPAADWEDGRTEALHAHLGLLAEFDRKAARIMAAFEGGTWEPSRYRYDDADTRIGWAA